MNNVTIIKYISVCLLWILSVSGIHAKAAEVTPLKLWYTKPATHWMTSSLPIGNGELGAMFYGGIEQEKIVFNEKTLWTGSPNIRGAYQSFGHIELDFDHSGDTKEYRRELCLENALGAVSYLKDGVRYEREYFASNPDKVIVVRLTAKGGKGKLNFSIGMNDTRAGVQTAVKENTLSFGNKLDLLSYEAQMKVLNEGGSITENGGKLRVSDANAVTIILAAATNFDISSATYVGETAEQLHERLSQCLKQASAKSYNALKTSHQKDYCSLFSRVQFDLKTEVPAFSTDELVRSHKEHPYLDMLYFQYGRYLLLSSSRGMNLPNNLQGIWNDDNTPPWECDIHSNINIQMNYWLAESCNLSECHQPFLRYIQTEALRPGGSFQQIARSENLRGWTINTQSNIFGYTDWNINRPANAWYCTHLWQHYAYTLDADYLKNIAFPVMRTTCEYWFDRLKPDADNKLMAPNEWSPEQGPWEDGVAYAQQLVWQLFSETIKATEVLKNAGAPVDEAFVNELNDKFDRLDNGVTIGSWGQIREWREDSGKLDTLGNQHRHLSNLIALYPGNQISYYQNKEFANAAKQTMLSRGDLGAGWSRAWKIACWARLLDGNHAYGLLKSALSLSTLTVVSMDNDKGGVFENLLDSHPPFQIDGNFGASAGIAEMLLQSHLGFIHFLPALPDAWQQGSVKGLRAQGDFTIQVEWQKGKLTTCSIQSGSGSVCQIYYSGCQAVSVKNNKGKSMQPTKVGENMYSFPTVKNGRYVISTGL